MGVRTLLACDQVPAFAATPSQWDISHAGTALDLSAYPTITFQDDFSSLSVTIDGGAGPWYAPVHGNFGVGNFEPPGSSPDPFSVAGGKLSITQRYSSGFWQSGIMQSVDSSGSGFSQTYGYFEATMAFPNSYGAWPSFWLQGVNSITSPGSSFAELDVVEAFGGESNDSIHYATSHIWPVHSSDVVKTDVGTSMFDGSYHQYGVMVTPTTIIVYFDRVEIARRPIYAEAALAKYMLIDLALGLAPADTSDQTLLVDRVIVYGP